MTEFEELYFENTSFANLNVQLLHTFVFCPDEHILSCKVIYLPLSEKKKKNLLLLSIMSSIFLNLHLLLMPRY